MLSHAGRGHAGPKLPRIIWRYSMDGCELPSWEVTHILHHWYFFEDDCPFRIWTNVPGKGNCWLPDGVKPTGPDNDCKNWHRQRCRKQILRQWGLYTACQEFDIRVLGVATDGKKVPNKKSSTRKKILKIPWLSRFEKKTPQTNTLASHTETAFFPRFVFTPKTLSAARLNLSKWSSSDVPKARGLHLHSLGRKPWWTQDGSVGWGAKFTWDFHWGPTKHHIFFSEM